MGVKPTHLVVFQHGLQGNGGEGGALGEALQSKFPEILYHAAECNAGRGINMVFYAPTMKGIDVCGENLAKEVTQVVASNPSLTEISFAGHSLGGLIIRYAISLLFDQDTGLIAGLKPHNFLTFASPHLGLRIFFPTLLQPFLGTFIGRTSDHLMLEADGDKEPLLLQMACKGGEQPYVEALEAFAHRAVLGNTTNDLRVPYSTATISPCTADADWMPTNPKSFPHIVYVADDLPGEFCTESAEQSPKNIVEPDSYEHKIIAGLRSTMAWHRVAVRFNPSLPLMAHGNIIMARPMLSVAGADVIEYVMGWWEGTATTQPL